MLQLKKKKSGKERYCQKCCITKPDRCHHCRHCNRCVLKMDHHCPWVNNCVGWRNYKCFILFLFYIIIISIYAAITLGIFVLPKFVNSFINGNVNLVSSVVIFFITGICGLCLSPFFIYHMQFISKNMTTIESFEKARKPNYVNVYDLGTAISNFEQVFGKNYLLWPIPINTSIGNGLIFPMRSIPTNAQEYTRLLNVYTNV